MATLSLREAAEQAGTSKSTIFRAIKAGRLSATKTDDGDFAIDPAELFRVYQPKTSTVAPERSTGQGAGHGATANEAGGAAPELALRLALAEAELRAMKEMLAELRQSRDDWRSRAERMVATWRGRPRREPDVGAGRAWSHAAMVEASGWLAGAALALRPHHFGTHSRAIFCASAICAGVIMAANASRLFTAISRSSPSAARRDAKSNHMWACT